VACGYFHTLAVTKDGALWTFGNGGDGALGHNARNNRLVPMRIEAQHFGNANIGSVAARVDSHSAVVTEEGNLYTWGEALGLGHADKQAKLVPTHITPLLLQGSRVGRCHDLPPMHALAFAMGTQARLGSDVVAGRAGRGAGGGGSVAGRRYKESQGVEVKILATMASFLTFTSHLNESCYR